MINLEKLWPTGWSYLRIYQHLDGADSDDADDGADDADVGNVDDSDNDKKVCFLGQETAIVARVCGE